jgi:alginate O-acetyltransferase complex protein AlgI
MLRARAMRFNTFAFWLFTAVVVTIFWRLPTRLRKPWLLLASYAFYASWDASYLALLVLVGALGCFGGRFVLLSPDPGGRRRRGVLVLTALAVELGAFKYLDWGAGTFNTVAGLFGLTWRLPLPHWVLPLGVSFYTFEAMSYVVECMKGKEKAYGFFQFQLFIGFFPHLVAGPIMRAKELLPQFEAPAVRLGLDAFLRSVWYVASGLLLKGLLADRLARHVDVAFARDVATLDAADALVTAVGFGLQIYLDFAAYSRMAVGAAGLLGIKLVENFNYPFRARTPAEFWTRWHISLSRWIRDYLYYPLVGKRLTLGAMCKASLVSMAICGLWHGAGFTFIVWGLYHGLLLAGYYVARSLVRKPPSDGGAPSPSAFDAPLGALLAAALTWVMLLPSWILFRATSLTQAWAFLSRMLTPWRPRASPGDALGYQFVALVMLGVWLAPFVAERWGRVEAALAATFPRGGSVALGCARGLVAGVTLVLATVALDAQTTFIYFQF